MFRWILALCAALYLELGGTHKALLVLLNSVTFFLTHLTDLDQLNHILNILGTPSQDDLLCIKNEKVNE